MSGLLVGMAIADDIEGRERRVFDAETVCGALQTYISTPNKDFQPMNANFGILSPLPVRIKDKKERYKTLAERALEKVKEK
jgi:methylenetetrahydrofolate--tRNA-(uracil-5-)-methyltransferase